MTEVKDWLSRLRQKNTFKPKVLARVSRNGKWFVGSSVAVSHFLRPLCLYNGICDFKQSLKKAVIYFHPLETEDKVLWNSTAFWFKAGYKTEKPPCQNYKFMFKNSSAFLGETDNLGQEGASANTVGGTFLAACGGYPPINQCLPDDDKPDNEAVCVALRSFRKKCTLFFENFEKIASKCFRTHESKDVKRLKNVRHTHVKRRIHIFGIKPECNGVRKVSFRFCNGLKYVENTSWKVLAYGIYARVVEVSEIERVRFLIQKRVRKYCMKHFPCGIVFITYILR